MDTAFDPYHRWLSIPPCEQPAHHYRLLGLRIFEDEVEVIENAAERQIAHVRPHLQSPLRPYATNLIRELDVARKCLLDREAKGAYDSWLHRRVEFSRQRIESRLGNRESIAATATNPSGSWNPSLASTSPIQSEETSAQNSKVDSSSLQQVSLGTTSPRSIRRKKRRTNPIGFLVLWTAGGAMGLLAGYAVLCLIDPKYDFLNVMFDVPTDVASRESQASDPSAELDRLARESLRPERSHRPTTRLRGAAQTPAGNVEPDSGRTARSDQRLSGRDNPTSLGATRPRIQLKIPGVLPLPSPASQFADVKWDFATLEDGFVFFSNDYKLQLSLKCNRMPYGSVALAELPTTGAPEVTWIVLWNKFEDLTVAQTEHDGHEVARFATNGNKLQFTWGKDVPLDACAALRNSLLEISLDGSRHTAALRAADVLEPIKISLARSGWDSNCRIEDAPDLNDIQFDISAGAQMPLHRIEGGGLKGLRIGDSRTISFIAAEGAGARVTIVEHSGLPAIEINLYMRLPSGEESDLNLRDGRRLLQRKKLRLAALEKQLERLRRNQAPTGNVAQEIAILRPDISALEGIGRETKKWSDEIHLGVRCYFAVDGQEIELAQTQ